MFRQLTTEEIQAYLATMTSAIMSDNVDKASEFNLELTPPRSTK